MITLGREAFGSSSSPANPGIRGITMISLNTYFCYIALMILLQRASIILFLTTPFFMVADMKN
jgi:hypothetical protein